MKSKHVIAALMAGSLTLVTSVRAADANDPAAPAARAGQPTPGQPGQSTREPGRSELAQEHTYVGVTHMIGREVRNDTGEPLGVVQDFIVNLDSYNTPFAIIRHGGALGMGRTRVAVPFKDLKWSDDTRQFSMAATKEQFLSASPTPSGGWTSLAGQDWASKIDRFYDDPAKFEQSQSARPELPEPSGGREFLRDATPPRPATTPEDKLQTIDPAANIPHPPTADTAVNAPPPPTADPGANPLTKPADGDLLAKVTKLIDQQTGPAGGGNVQVTVENGTVTLKGKVATASQKQDLETQIKSLGGVANVIDDQLSAPNE